MADRNEKRRPLYMGMVPPGARPASDVYLEDGETVEAAVTELQEQAGKKFELVDTITTEEDLNLVDITIPDGYKEIIINAEIQTGNDSYATTYRVNNELNYAYVGSAIATAIKYHATRIAIDGDLYIGQINTASTGRLNTTSVNSTASYSHVISGSTTITNIKISSVGTIPTGSTFTIYGK